MEVQRRARKNKIINNIRDAETTLKRSEETIKRIKNSQMGEEYVKAQIIKLKLVIVDKKELLKNLNDELYNVLSGSLDDEIVEEQKKVQKTMENHQKRLKIKKEEKKVENDGKKEISKEYWKGIITASKSHRQKEKDVQYGYKYFNKVIDTLPSYMTKNLADMPNNKGYIWRGIHFYGDLPEQSGPRVMFEKQRGGILVIHEYTDSEYKRYEKDGKNNKKLVHKAPRKKKQFGISIMDFLKK